MQIRTFSFNNYISAVAKPIQHGSLAVGSELEIRAQYSVAFWCMIYFRFAKGEMSQ